ncbi:hypothetical protein C8F04DRAFT_385812 [Mycena alexandri]|uniref:F-box domain-containing protein n=1 Tax=Mycena alexandri TaxID=1745969 RepID=A0AAD6X3S7_9AGAR|nr:hypothetical protein C8F04DRAFT_385812 [Mycena alexandri]
MESPWPQIPLELAYEIALHNAKDRPALFTMTLVSKSMHALALNHLFASVRLNSAQDFIWWGEMLRQTPSLRNNVKRVKFSAFGKHSRRQTSHSPRAIDPPTFDPMSGVQVVEWHGRERLNLTMARACMALFPNIVQLRLAQMNFDSWDALSILLGSCGAGLKALDLIEVRAWEDPTEDLPNFAPRYARVQISSSGEDLPTNEFDLSGLSKLKITAPDYTQNYLIRLMEVLLPRALKSLAFNRPRRWHDSPTQLFSLRPLEELLRPNASTLVNLVLNHLFWTITIVGTS